MRNIFLLMALALPALVHGAVEPVKTVSAAPATNAFGVAIVPDATHLPVTVTNTVMIANERVTYTAETGMLPLLKPDGTPRASVFYVAYTRTGITNQAARPVTFCTSTSCRWPSLVCVLRGRAVKEMASPRPHHGSLW